MLFSDINISQGSVATFVKCGGIFNYSFITNLLLSSLVKKIENRSAFDEVTDKSMAVPFFPGHGVEAVNITNHVDSHVSVLICTLIINASSPLLHFVWFLCTSTTSALQDKLR